MQRTLAMLLVIAVVGGGAWWFLQEREPTPIGDGETAEEAAASDRPTLIGGGEAAAPTESAPATVLPRGLARIDAVVVDPHGQPVSGASVELHLYPVRTFFNPGGLRAKLTDRDVPGPPFVVKTSGVDGRVRFDGLDATKMFALEVAPPAPFSGGRFSAYPRATWSRPLTMMVVPGTPLTVHLLDALGAPRAGVVSLSMQMADWEGAHLRRWYSGTRATDTHGSLTFAHVPAGSYAIHAIIPGQGERQNVTVRTPEQREVTVSMAVEPGATLHGTVTNEEGAPIEGAIVAVQSGLSWNDLHARMTHSGSDGTYRIEGLTPGALFVVQCSKEPYVEVRKSRGEYTVVLDAPLTLDFTMKHGVWLEGIVRVFEGASIPGARIKATVMMDEQGSHVAWADADDAGRYRLGPLPSGRALVTPMVDGFVPRSSGEMGLVTMRGMGLRVLIGKEGPIQADLIMDLGEPVGGVVLNAEGTPVAGAALTLTGPRAFYGIDYPSTSTDEAGRFRFGLPEAAAYEIQLSVDGFGRQKHSIDPGLDNEIRLSAGGVVAGRVAWKLPPSGRLLVHAESESGTKRSATVAGDGAFRFARLEVGRWSLFFQDAFRERAGRVVDVRVTAQADITDLVLDLPDFRTIDGVFVDADGKPIYREQLIVSRVGEDDPHARSRTARDGRFRVANLVPGTYQLAHVEFAEPVVANAGDIDVRLVAAPRQVFRGTVTLNGAPVVAGSLQISERRTPTSFARIVDGAFEHETRSRTVPEVGVTVQRVEDAKGQRLSVMPFSKQLPTGEVAKIELAPARRATVTVVDAQGKGIVGVFLTVWDASRARHPSRMRPITTDAEGRCELFGLSETEVSIHVQPPPAYERIQPTVLLAGKDTLRIVLPAGGTVKGQVVGPDGKPVDQAHLSFRGPDGFTTSTSTNVQGNFTLGSLPQGATGQVNVNAHGKPLASEVINHVKAGTTGLRIQLGRAGAVKGKVVDPDGNPLAEVQVSAGVFKEDGSGSWTSRRTDKNGRFVFAALRTDQEYAVSAGRSGPWGPAEAVQVTPPATDVVLRMTVGPRVEGRVVGENVKGTRVSLARERAGMISVEYTTAAEDGSFAISSTQETPGVLLAIDYKGGRYAILEDVKAPRSGIVLDLKPATTIAGRIENLPPGTMWAGVTARAGVIQLGAMAKPDGTFLIRSVPPGTYLLLVTAGRAKPLEIPNVAAGTTDLVIKFPDPK